MEGKLEVRDGCALFAEICACGCGSLIRTRR